MNKLKDQIRKKLAKGKSIEDIADEVEESIEVVTDLVSQIEFENGTEE